MEEEFEEFEDDEEETEEDEEEVKPKPTKQQSARPQPVSTGRRLERPEERRPERQEVKKPEPKPQPNQPTMDDVIAAVQNLNNGLQVLDQRINAIEASLFRLKGAI